MTRMADEYERADHYRDLAKHDDTPPLYAQSAPLSTAMDIALCVRNMKNVQDAAALIERFVDAKAQEQRLDAVAAGARP